MFTPASLDAPHGPGRPEREAARADDIGLALLLDEYSSERAEEHTAEPEAEPSPQRPTVAEPAKPSEHSTTSDDIAPASGRAGWCALIATMLARACLFTIASLVLWSAMPALLGWHPTVVVTGSMEPRIRIGDVVISKPIDAQHVRVGQILLVDDPDRPGELRLHRLVRITPAGLILRGDANAVADSTPVKRSAVHGLAVLRAPVVGQPMVWFRTKQYVPLAAVLVLLGLLFRVATWWRPDTDDESDDDDDAASLGSSPSDLGTDRSDDAPSDGRHRRRRHNLIRFGTAVALVLTTAGNPFGTQKASAAFVKTTGNPTNTVAANGYFSCSATVGATSPALPATIAWPLSERSGTTISDVSGNNSTGTASGGVGYNATGPCPSDGRRAMTFNGSNSYIYGNTKLAPVPTTMSLSVWFKTSTGGGVMAGFMDNQSEASANAYDRMIWLTDSGNVVFGVYTSDFATVISPATYLDNQWHHAVATLAQTGSYNGLRLYVDGALVKTNTTAVAVATPYGYDGYFRVGHNVVTGWPNTSTKNYYTGALAFAVVYNGALTPTQIAGVYGAAPGTSTVIEAETMPIGTSSPTPFKQADYGGMTWRGGAHMVCSCSATGNYMTLSFYVPVAGTYTVLLVQTMNNNFATNSVAVDGTTVGAWFDGYAPSPRVSTPVSYGSLSLSAGAHNLKLSVTTKNAGSSNYVMGLDYMILR